ncbi:conserved Plasmodium protein, unknown function [Plasmodium relictum]|uniref:Glutaredoxin-like protein n=1 Tax=Plasmodium relictum TaxID=85471 RepID=A0A1J1HDT0_PLARL|nr:conserved Plasmodium protein, unknown function [Plasmodium relictum]CRH01574.1 conserved Plasmodium protein, unknown function [Plasmodium relictum]
MNISFLFLSIVILCCTHAFCFRQHESAIFFFGFVQNEKKKLSSRRRLRPLHVVSTYKELLSKLNNEHKGPYVISLYHSTLCTYCSKITNFLEMNKDNVITKKYENGKLEDISKVNKPIVVLLKNINVENSIEKSPFFDELRIKGRRCQVPALEIGDFIMFESDDIIKLLKFLINKIEKKKKKEQ